MTRFLLILGGILLGIALLAGLVAMLAIGSAPERSGTMTLPGLERPVTVAWDARGIGFVEASNYEDLAAGIGYVHTVDYAWPMMYWRDAANGRFRTGEQEVDFALNLHALRLGFAETAQETYLRLPIGARRLLDAYARGVNQAIADPGVSQGDAFVLLDLAPEPWEPWDALAVEALHAYLASNPITNDTTWAIASEDVSVRGFARVDSLFRSRIGLEPGQPERILFAELGGNRSLISQVPTGSSSLPFFVPMALRIAGGRSTAAATIPGSLSLPFGSRPGLAWSVSRTSTLSLQSYSGALPDTLYSRLVNDVGEEKLLAVPRDSSGLIVARIPVAKPDSTVPQIEEETATASPPIAWKLTWSGFRGASDLESYIALLAGTPMQPLQLLSGTGVLASGSEVRALGRPVVAARSANVLLVSDDSLVARLARRFARLSEDADVTSERLAVDRVSPWAKEMLEPMLAVLAPQAQGDRKTEIPLQYLKSWRFEYGPEAIAPTIFEAWLDAHRSITGSFPVMTDSVHVALLPYSLRLARAVLRDSLGVDHSTWRWSRMSRGTRPPAVAVGQAAADRIAPASPGGPGGHPTAFLPGPSTLASMPEIGPAVWTFRSEIASGVLFASPPRTDADPMGLSKRVHPLTGVRLAVDPATQIPLRHLRLVPGNQQ